MTGSDLALQVIDTISKRTHYHRDLHMARSIVGADDAEDVVQEAYLRAFRFRDSYRGGSLNTWLYRIVQRTAFDHYRNRRQQVIGEDAEYFLALAQDNRSSPEAVCIARDLLSTVQAALDAAEDIHPSRKVIGVVVQQEYGMSKKEIAEANGIGSRSVNWYAFKAREAARDMVRRIEEWDALMVVDVERDAA